METDILILGAGLTGLNAAREIHETAPELRVLVADAGGGASSEIMGFSAPVNPPDSAEVLCSDTFASGGGYSDPALVRILADRAEPEMRRLETMGIRFDRTPDGHYSMVNAVGTSFPRVVHSGTTTGKQAIALLKTDVLKTRIVRLALGAQGIAGAWTEHGEFIRARAVVLAGGGFAGLWKFSTWSKNLRGDPAVLALEAGAELRDLQFVQFEPTVTVYPANLAGFPVITTVLHEGAKLLNRRGESLLKPGENVPRKRELAERILREIRAGNGWEHGGIRYDFSEVDETAFAAKYPEYHLKFKRISPVFNELWFEVKPGAHTTLGGIRIAPDCSTCVPGLFAAGEAAGGLHGRDRLGGNAGLEVFVFGHLAGKSAARYAASHGFCAPQNSFARQPEPEGFFRQTADLLDRRFDPLSTSTDFEAGLAEARRLPECAHKKLVCALFRMALEHSLPAE